MDISDELRATHKQEFLKFFEQYEWKDIYMPKIKDMMHHKRHRLILNISDFLTHENRDLGRRLLQTPGEYMQALCDAVTELTRGLDPKYLKEGDQVLVGFEGPFVSRRVTPRDLLSSFIGSLVCVEGIVTKCSRVRLKVVKSVHYCPATKAFTSREYRDIASTMGLPTGSVYPTMDENGNLLETEYGLCKYKDHQTLSMQEVPENATPGQLPRTVDVIVEDDLVDACKPGDRVAVVGIYRVLPGSGNAAVSRTILIANNVSLLNKEASAPFYSADDVKNILKLRQRDDILDLLANSLAPSIHGHLWIKKAVILLLLGGAETILKNGTHLRGDINMMMVGDPSVAKSQLLRAIMNVAPLAISTTGRGSSGVGLTAAVTSDQETGERRLEAGAMVLADRGVVCIDEFDKMNDQDRVAIHEVMEQQTVTIAKAGIRASLNARCSVVAAANPIHGTYDRSLTPTKNIGLPDSLLSRFDLLFIVLDEMDADIDRQISEHVLRMHRFPSAVDGGGATLDSSAYGREEEDSGSSVFVKYNRMLHGQAEKCDTLTINFLKKYIHYAKYRVQPELTDEASNHIRTAYANLRRDSSADKTGIGTLPITVRTLETMIRLSTAHAKLTQSKEVLKSDVEAALEVLHFGIYAPTKRNEMDELENEREELERERKSDLDNGCSADGDRQQRDGGDDTVGAEATDVDEPPQAQHVQNMSPKRIQAFLTILGKHSVDQYLAQDTQLKIPLADVENVVNSKADVPYSREEILYIIEKEVDKFMLYDGEVYII